MGRLEKKNFKITKTKAISWYSSLSFVVFSYDVKKPGFRFQNLKFLKTKTCPFFTTLKLCLYDSEFEELTSI